MAVITPCPISSIESMMRALLSGVIFTQTFGSNAVAASSVASSAPSDGRYAPIISPPPAAVAVFRKVRRLVMVVSIGDLPYARWPAARLIARWMR